MNVYEPFQFWRRAAPSRPALMYPGGFVTYGQLGGASDEAAAALSRAGFRAKETIAINVVNPVFQIILILACGRLNIPVSFFKNAAAGSRVGLSISGTITEAPEAPNDTGRILKVDHNWFVSKLENRKPVRFTPAPCVATDVLRIVVTSGSTGVPKALRLTHENFEARIRAAVSHPDSQRTICMLSPSSSWGYLILLKTLRSGGTFCVAPFPNQILDLCETTQAEVICASVAQAASLIEEQKTCARELRNVKHLFIGGSPSSLPLIDDLKMLVCRNISVGYGATETGQSASGPLAAFEGITGAAGFLHPGYNVEIVDDEDNPVQPEISGRVRIASPGSASEYTLTVAIETSAFRGSWFYTGDIGKFTKSGVLVIDGRETETVINKGGFKVAASQVEDALRKELALSDAAVFGGAAANGAPQIWAAVVSAKPIDTKAAQRILEEKLGAMAPDRIVRVDTIPRNDTGKVLYQTLRSQLATS